jgi:CubicO group peptidase (beta-lactamase class C family)
MGARAAGSRMADLISDLLWQPLGTELDAEITCDVVGSAVRDGGISTTTRDLARLRPDVHQGHLSRPVSDHASTSGILRRRSEEHHRASGSEDVVRRDGLSRWDPEPECAW